MKNILKIALIISLFGSFGCQKDNEDIGVFQVEVIGKGFDCGDEGKRQTDIACFAD